MHVHIGTVRSELIQLTHYGAMFPMETVSFLRANCFDVNVFCHQFSPSAYGVPGDNILLRRDTLCGAGRAGVHDFASSLSRRRHPVTPRA